MKNRMIKFMIMLLTVIAVGSGATMLNLSLRADKIPPEKPYGSYGDGQYFMAAETGAYSVKITDGKGNQGMLAEQDPQINSLTEPQEMVDEQESIPADDQILEDKAGGKSESLALEAQPETEGDAAAEGVDPYKILISGSDKAESRQSYYARLQDMERVQASLMGAAMRESLADQQSAADTVLKLWDDELNSIYQRLKDSLSEDAFRVLRDEERAWIRSRDEAAGMAASKENNGNSARNLAYTRSLLDWTKARVYELAEMYYGDVK